jgi:hypothetical protein
MLKSSPYSRRLAEVLIHELGYLVANSVEVTLQICKFSLTIRLKASVISFFGSTQLKDFMVK